MSPAAPTRPDATINATDEATAPPLDDALAARGETPATPRATGTRVDAGRFLHGSGAVALTLRASAIWIVQPQVGEAVADPCPDVH